MKLLLHWVLSALALLLVSRLVNGFHVSGLMAALLAAAVIGLINATLGLVLKILTFPLAIVTFGIFLLVVNALMLEFASLILPGFRVDGFWPAFWGALLLALLGMVIRGLTRDDEYRRPPQRD